MYEALQRQCHDEFAYRAQLAVAAALDDFEAVEFEPRHTVDDCYVLEPRRKNEWSCQVSRKS